MLMKTRRSACAGMALVAAFALTGCATLQDPDTSHWQGPTVRLLDTYDENTGSKAAFYAVVEIDGKQVANAIVDTRRRSYGHGFALSASEHLRFVPVRPMQVRLVGTHATAAPIHEFFSRVSGNFQSVEGVVTFTPQPDVSYVVRGDLAATPPSVWIENQDTRERVVVVRDGAATERVSR